MVTSVFHASRFPPGLALPNIPLWVIQEHGSFHRIHNPRKEITLYHTKFCDFTLTATILTTFFAQKFQGNLRAKLKFHEAVNYAVHTVHQESKEKEIEPRPSLNTRLKAAVVCGPIGAETEDQVMVSFATPKEHENSIDAASSIATMQ